MIICSSCGFENIDGADVCENCRHSLVDEHGVEPATEVERCLAQDTVEVLRPNSPVAVGPDMPVRDVIRLLVERDIGCAVVVEQQRLVGIFTERDALLKLNVDAAELGGRPVSEFMTSEPQTLAPSSKVAFAVQRMDLGSFRHVPIIEENGQVTGMISVRDILAYLTDRMRRVTA